MRTRVVLALAAGTAVALLGLAVALQAPGGLDGPNAATDSGHSSPVVQAAPTPPEARRPRIAPRKIEGVLKREVAEAIPRSRPADTDPPPDDALPENFEWSRHTPYEGASVYTVSSEGISDALLEAMEITGVDCRGLAAVDGEVVFDVVVFNAGGRGITYAAGISADDAESWEDSENVDMINCQNEQLRHLQFDAPPPGEIFRFDVPIPVVGQQFD